MNTLLPKFGLFTFAQKYPSSDMQAGQKLSIRLQSGHDWNLNDIF
jgi:hypothetical protein